MKGKYAPLLFAIAVLVIVIIVVSLSTYAVTPGEAMLKVSHGKVTSVATRAGLHWKVPLLEELVRLDLRARVARGQVRLHADEKTGLAAGYMVLWEVGKPKRYYEATGGDASALEQRIHQALQPVLRQAMQTGSAGNFLSGATAALSTDMAAAVQAVAAKTGIRVLAVKPSTAEIPRSLVEKTTASMAAAVRTKLAASKARFKAERAQLLGKAKRKSEKIIATAKRKAAGITGKSQAKVASIYAPVARKAPRFFDYYLGLQSKADALKGHTRILVLSMDSPWLEGLDKSVRSANGSR